MSQLLLTDEEISELCSPLVQPAAQIRYLKSQGFVVKTKPNGKPMLSRAHVEQVMGSGPQRELAAAAPTEPNFAGLSDLFSNRRGRRNRS